jgi:surfactin synthase thioesterase subunit
VPMILEDRTACWTASLRPVDAPARRRLVVFPHAGSGPNAYLPLLTPLPEDVEVLGVTLPGRERRVDEPCTDDIGYIIDSITVELLQRPPLPTVLFGHSLGAQLAFGIATAHPELCSTLAISAQMPPAEFQLPDRPNGRPDVDVFLRGADVPPELLEDPQTRDWLSALLASDLSLSQQAAQRYRASVVNVPLLVLGGDDDPLVSSARLRGWREHAGSDVRTRTFSGGHFYLFGKEAGVDLRSELLAALDAGTAGWEPRAVGGVLA